MRPASVMLVAGEPSGDALAAELVRELRPRLLDGGGCGADVPPPTASLAPRFFGAGGPRMAAEGVEVVVDMMEHSVVGLIEVAKELATFRRLLHRLIELACRRQPEVIILVDYAGFNRRFAAAVQRRARRRPGQFGNWHPKVVYFVSPQVWASRSGRVYQLARDVDLLLSIFPFEKAWYAQRVPAFPVEFVGHPMLDRYSAVLVEVARKRVEPSKPARVLLLPGSRIQEVRRHLLPMLAGLRQLEARIPLDARMVLPDDRLRRQAEEAIGSAGVTCQVGGLAEALAGADLAIASSGTITMECALFEVPTVVIYRVAWPTYWIAMRIVQIDHMAMPNLLAGERLYPELLQGEVTPAAIAREALDLLTNLERRTRVRAGLRGVRAQLGGPGACRRAADAIVRLL